MNKLWVYAGLVVVGCALFIGGAHLAYIERGYRAFGGEWLLLIIPAGAIIKMIKLCIRQSRPRNR